MGKSAVYAFNRGLLSPHAFCRTDIERTALSAETFTNYNPRLLGSMSLRPGLKYLAATASNAQAVFHDFKFSATDVAQLEFTNLLLRIWVNDAPISRPAVSTAVTNGTFGSNVTGWSDADESGAVSDWKSGGYLSLVGTGVGGAAAKRTQQVTVGGADINVEHALRVTIERGPVTLRVGSAAGGEQYVEETQLGTGIHSLAFTPTGDFHITLSSYTEYEVLVDSVIVESTGIVSLTTVYPTASLSLIRTDQSGDVVYVACEGYPRYKIERRSTESWSIVKFQPEDGAFRHINTTPITIDPSDTDGDITLTASAALFRAGHVGALFRMTHLSQKKNVSITAQNTYSDPIEVTNIGGARAFGVILEGTWVATVTLQYSVGVVGSWVDYDTFTSNQAISVNDGLDNQIIFYRIGVKTGEFTSGTIDATLTHSSGAQAGIVRINTVSSGTSATASVLVELGSGDATSDWEEEVFSDYRGQPTMVKLFQGRLWWFGSNRTLASVSDEYESYADDDGDSACINRNIGVGTNDTISWAAGVSRLLMGCANAELEVRTSINDEPLTNSNTNIVDSGTQGSAKISAVRIDNLIVFVQAALTRLYQAQYDYNSSSYVEGDLTAHIPEVCEPAIVKIVVQRKPDTRIHCIRSDGKVAILLFDNLEELKCWFVYETDGTVEDASVLPGTIEDAVYYTVKRTINAATVRYHEKFALNNDCIGATYVYEGDSATLLTDLPYPNGITVTVYNAAGTKVENLTVTDKSVTLTTAAVYALLVPSVHLLADSFIEYTGSLTAAMTGLTHLEGESVVVRGDGKDLGTYTVSSGAITLSETVRNAVIGLPYTAQWMSTKLAFIHSEGGRRKAMNGLSLVMRDTYYQGLRMGPTFDKLSGLPKVQDGKVTDTKHIWDDHDKDMEPIYKTYTTDTRLCLQSAAPNPCTLLAAIVDL